ncbi:TetR/AcrR family transcriptional regulator [Vibrio viridaestus]|uniref:TetR/AcrR family transcriptional regulator n=1 Tax=Vibrio viridaestus TaxID=2487322 RepID=A0A3N9TEU0_9VIBR|nr:TetR/AcrR family transcriptional regulator [Vibrio viridaestus]RQW62639.1 TetR/AcrR family transcriptional regulator [Vibrio viridaestus]
MTEKRTQSERSRLTQTRILDAALACILEKGIKDTSTVDVSKVAKVSRGALLHHYPTKETLMHAALERLLNDEIEKVRVICLSFNQGDMGLEQLLSALWAHFAGDLFMISLEYLNAARTDRAIKEILTPLAAQYNSSMEDIWQQLTNDSFEASERSISLHVTLCMLRGMAAQSIWRDDPKLYQGMLDFWRKTLIDTGLVLPENPRKE